MNPERLLEHYHRIADAEDAVPRLRRFVLDLAVRGKLVEQNPSDEPAAELLKRIAVEKARLVTAGEFREPRNAVEINRNALPFAVPAHWVWSRLIEIARPSYGFAFKSSQFNGEKRGMPLIRIRDISRTDTEAYYEGDYDPAYLVHLGDYLVGMDGNFNLRCWQGPDGLLNQRVMRINRWRCEIDPGFVRLPLQIVLDYLHGDTSLMTVKHLSAKQVNGIEIPLPPLAEQHRIVAKVDELMALCDQLEAARNKRETTRDRLSAACLARLTAPGTGREDFPVHARFALGALPALTARPGQIKVLRQAILNLAVRGKLVEQDPADEPAAELLRAIRKKFKKLYAEKKIPKPKTMPVIEEMELPFNVPKGWEWSMLGQLCYQVSDGPHFSPQYIPPDNGVPFLSTRNVRLEGFDLSSIKYVSRTDHEEFCKRIKPEPSDILYTKGGTTGIAKVNDLDFEFSVWVHLAVLRIEKERLFPRYIELALNSPHCYAQSQEYTRGISNFDLGLTRMIKITIPLPPLAEQRRIVAKADELMALCDRLETTLTAADTTRQRLFESLLHEALATGEEREEAV